MSSTYLTAMDEVRDIARDLKTGMADFRARLEKLELERDERAVAKKRIGALSDPREARDSGGFGNFGELLATLRFAPGDGRLAELQQRALSGPEGGVLIPDAWSSQLTAHIAQASVVRGRAREFPVDEAAPDQALEVPALDYTAGRRAGVEVAWLGDGGFSTSDKPTWRSIRFEPLEIGAICTLPDKLLRNTAIAQEVLFQLFADAIGVALDEAFMRGNGTAKPLGIFGHAATLTVPRDGPDGVTYGDLTNMLAKSRPGGNYAWVISRTCLPALMAITLPGDTMPAFVPDATAGLIGRMFGIPVLEWEAAPVLGDEGDVGLYDFGWGYGIKPGVGMRIDLSNAAGTNFTDGKTSFRVLQSIDGQPLLSAPLTLEDGVTTVSPFVLLTDPA